MTDQSSPAGRDSTVFPPNGGWDGGRAGRPTSDAGPKLAVIVVNYGAHTLIERNLAAAALDTSEIRVVVVDNFSSVAEADAIAALAADHGWSLVSRSENAGFGVGVNAGIDEAITLGADCFLLINPDARIEAGVVRSLHEQCRAQPLAMVAPRVYDSNGAVYFDGAVVDLAKGRIRGLAAVSAPVVDHAGCTGVIDDQRRPIEPWLTGACVMFGVEVYRRTGGMDDAYFLYWEDVDLSCRARAAGASLIIRHDLRILHDEGGTQGARTGRAKSSLYYYYNCRNRLLFASQHVPRRQLPRWILRTPAVSWSILMQGGRRQLLDSPGLFLAALRGTAAGLRIALRALLRGGDATRGSSAMVRDRVQLS